MTSAVRERDKLESSESLSALALQLEDQSAENILRWASERYGTRLTFATGFGAEGCVLIDLMGRHNLPIDVFTLDTGVLFEETYSLWQDLESRYGITIRSVASDLTIQAQAEKHGDQLWERKPDQCCDIRKVKPLKAALADIDAWVTAIRRQQTPERANARVVEWDTKFDIVKINPLVAWTKKDVWRHITKHGVPYNPLHDRGYPSIGCEPCTSQVKPGEDERAGRWRGSNKNECGLHGPLGLPRQE